MKVKLNSFVLFLLCLIMAVGSGCTTLLAADQGMTPPPGNPVGEQKLQEAPPGKTASDGQSLRKENIRHNRTQSGVAGSVSVPVYFIAQLNIRDRSGYSRYVAGFMDILSRYDGRLLSFDESPQLFEGKWNYTRTVILAFPSEAAAKSWYYSEDYQRLAQHRLASSDTNLVLIKGVDRRPRPGGELIMRTPGAVSEK